MRLTGDTFAALLVLTLASALVVCVGVAAMKVLLCTAPHALSWSCKALVACSTCDHVC